MQCLIIAAGQGTRLRAEAKSKPLAEINGQPLIEHVIGRAAAGGASEFVVITGYEAPRLEAFLRAFEPRLGLSIKPVYNPEWARPNGLSVLAGSAHLRDRFILLMSDHLFDPAILRRFLDSDDSSAELRLASDYRTDDPDLDLDDATKVAVATDGHILRIGKTLVDYQAIDTGIFVASRSLLEAIEAGVAAGGSGSLSEGVQKLADRRAAHAFDIGEGWWIDVDDAPALRRARETMPAALAGT